MIMERNSRSGFEASGRGGRSDKFEKKAGKPEFGGNSKGRAGYAPGRRDSSGRAGSAYDKRDSDARGSQSYGKRKPEGRGDLPSGKRDSEGWGKPSYGGRDSEDRGSSSGYRGPSAERKGASSTYNRNAKKSATKDKFINKSRQDSDIEGLQEDLDKLEGRNSVLEALRSGRSINRIFVSKGEREGSVNQIIAMARQSHILIQEIDRAKLDEMSVTHAHQGVIALTAAKDYVEVDEILKRAEESGRPPFIIILDEITDPHNLGSMLRTANAAGVHGIIIPKRRAIGLTASVSKASAGAIEYVPVARVTNIVQAIENLKKHNIWIAGTDSTGEKAYFECDLTGPIALVIGSEGEGMGKLVRESCDFVVNIPMLGKISSLNAAVAGAIVTYEIFRQRSTKRS